MDKMEFLDVPQVGEKDFQQKMLAKINELIKRMNDMSTVPTISKTTDVGIRERRLDRRGIEKFER